MGEASISLYYKLKRDQAREWRLLKSSVVTSGRCTSIGYYDTCTKWDDEYGPLSRDAQEAYELVTWRSKLWSMVTWRQRRTSLDWRKKYQPAFSSDLSWFRYDVFHALKGETGEQACLRSHKWEIIQRNANGWYMAAQKLLELRDKRVRIKKSTLNAFYKIFVLTQLVQQLFF